MSREEIRTAKRAQIVEHVCLVVVAPLQNSRIDRGRTIDNLIRHVFISVVTDQHNRSRAALMAVVLVSFHIITFEYELTTTVSQLPPHLAL